MSAHQNERAARNQQKLEQATFAARRFKIHKICKALDELHKYGVILSSDTSDEAKAKGDLLQRHALAMKDYILPYYREPIPFPPDYHQSFLNRLHEHDDALHVQRDGGLKILLANIALFILGACGIAYLPALAIHKLSTGRNLFFDNTRSDSLVNRVERQLSGDAHDSAGQLRTDWYQQGTGHDPLLGMALTGYPVA